MVVGVSSGVPLVSGNNLQSLCLQRGGQRYGVVGAGKQRLEKGSLVAIQIATGHHGVRVG